MTGPAVTTTGAEKETNISENAGLKIVQDRNECVPQSQAVTK